MALRSLLLFLSRRKRLRKFLETSRLAERATSRFIAGLALDDALEVGRRLQRDGIQMSVDWLGESVNSLNEAAASRDGYIGVLHRLHEIGLDATVSIKLTQFGLDVSREACRKNVRRLVSEAAKLGLTVEIDMESSEHVDRTFDLVSGLWAEFGHVRGVVQAYLHRAEKDAARLSAQGVPLRLCKGAYREPPAVAFQKKSEVDRNYARLARYLLEHGNNPALATHDEILIQDALDFAAEKRIPPDRFEFQMLYGIRRDLERRFAAAPHRLRLYVPYGEAWYPYFMRRLAERPANLLFLLRNYVRG
ncbi:MAG: proline dehydrogenase family protein [Bryobacteraceae bacterium]